MKNKYPLLYLCQIPIEILFYVILVEIAAKIDVSLFCAGADLGDGRTAYPYFTVAVLVVATVALVIAVITSIVNCVRFSIKKHKKKQAAKEAMK